MLLEETDNPSGASHGHHAASPSPRQGEWLRLGNGWAVLAVFRARRSHRGNCRLRSIPVLETATFEGENGKGHSECQGGRCVTVRGGETSSLQCTLSEGPRAGCKEERVQVGPQSGEGDRIGQGGPAQGGLRRYRQGNSGSELHRFIRSHSTHDRRRDGGFAPVRWSAAAWCRYKSTQQVQRCNCTALRISIRARLPRAVVGRSRCRRLDPCHRWQNMLSIKRRRLR